MDYKVSKLKLSLTEVLQKMKSWCAYQERSHFEAQQKLARFDLTRNEMDSILTQLISENYLNEERFAIAFAGGKFRIKHWGKNKIKLELKKRGVSDYSVNKALSAIAPSDYHMVILKVIEKRQKLLKSEDPQKRIYSLLNYLISRGFESDIASENLSKLQL